MAGRLGLLAFGGDLPLEIQAADPGCFVATFAGVPSDVTPTIGQPHHFERLGALVSDLKRSTVDRLVLAGALTRPRLDMTRLDAVTLAQAPRLMPALAAGDDALLRQVIRFFEESGFEVVGAHQIAPGLLVEPGLHLGPDPDAAMLADADHALAIVAALGPLDVGQAAVVAAGQCLGIETLQGTDALLAAVAALPADLRPGAPGVLVKAPKPQQDLRVDMPALGPETIRGAARAGLAGILVTPRRVLLIDRPAVEAALDETGLFLLARG
ncbi:UDP-2,3-diacylglucosamine diphosphatase LpxI [Pseudooceanicola sp.]|uniref:LpxI family protein n=1 Tax=Pseudooceanicola sp. TaxID=1914328 RepID=UPI0026192AB8|nr:UDP-2,3-diacylglucosamine diphosphatase LpxI [Pseudooceanicola sp.]MDF1855811.1 UDP-2,3-diacylglucosamine diphosphatase LpxI [Pseudooceanicola sp.]